jgi:hypothetical protein
VLTVTTARRATAILDLVIASPPIASPPVPSPLIACSVCLRVLRGTEWVEAERAIRDLRSFALPAPPRFESALCDHCTESIDRRRREPKETLAA